MTALSHNHFADEPNRPFLADGVVNNAYHEEEGLGTISCAGTANQLIWSIYIPVDQTEYPSPKYGQEDIDAFVKKYGHVKFCADYSISDVYKTKIGANMIAMEENVLPTKWSVRLSPGSSISTRFLAIANNTDSRTTTGTLVSE